MKKLSILFTAFILSSQAFSQLTYSWIKTLPFTSYDDNNSIRGIESSIGGNVYIMGNFSATTDFDPSSTNFFLTPNISKSCFLAKYTSSGNFIWAKEIISQVNSGFSYLDVNDLVIDASENIYLTGSFNEIVDFDPSSTTYTLSANVMSSSNPFVYTAKYNSNGNLVWVKDIRRPGSSSAASFGRGLILSLDNSNNVYVGACVLGRAFFCKYNNTGTMLWKDSISGAYLTSLFVNGSGEVFISGSFTGNVDMDPGIGSNVLSGSGSFIGKYTTSGTHIWGKKIVGTGIRDITVDGLGNVFSCGVGGTNQNTIAKWDANGNLQWMNFFHTNVVTSNYGCSDISISCNNEIVITGIANNAWGAPNYDPLGGTYTCTPNSSLGFAGSIFNFIAAYSPSNGSIVWAKCVGGFVTRNANVSNGNEVLPFSSSYIDNNGSIYLINVAGGSSIGIVNDFDPNSGVVTFSTSTSGTAFFAKYTGCGTVGIEENSDANNINVSPNPSSDKFIFSNLIGENKIEVMDITGRLILSDDIKYSSYTLSMDDLPKGMYFYKITDAKGQLKQGKLLLQ